MALKKTKISSQLSDAILDHVCKWGTDGKVDCIDFCPVGPWLVDSFVKDSDGKAVVNLYPYSLEGGEHPITVFSPEQFNRRECKALMQGIEANADALAYRALCNRMNEAAGLGEKTKKINLL